MLRRPDPTPEPTTSRKFIHDLNNAMTGILTMSEFCLRDTQANHPHHEALQIIYQSAQRARDLIAQFESLNKTQD